MLKIAIAQWLIILLTFPLPAHAESSKSLAEKFGNSFGEWILKTIHGSHEQQFLEAGLKNCIENFETSREPELNGFDPLNERDDNTLRYMKNRIIIKQKNVKDDEYRLCSVEIFKTLSDELEIDWQLIKRVFDDWADAQIQNKRYCNVEPKDPNGYVRILDFKGPREGKALRVVLNITGNSEFGFIFAGELDWAEAGAEC